MKILGNNYNIFVDTKNNTIACVDANKITPKLFDNINDFRDFILQLPPKKVNIYYVGQNITIKQKQSIITSNIIDRLKKLKFEKEKAKDSISENHINILNNFGLDNIITFESMVGSGSIPNILQETANTIINSQHIIAKFIDVGYLLYQFALSQIKFISYNHSMCIINISFLNDIYVIEFNAGLPEFIKKVPKDGISDGIEKIQKYCQEKSIVNDDYIIITDDKAKVTDEINLVKSHIDEDKITTKELDDFAAPTMPIGVFENIYYPETIKQYLHHARVITNLKRLSTSLVMGISILALYNFQELQTIRGKKFSYDNQSKQLSKDFEKLQSIKVDEFYVKNFSSLQCIECEAKDKINIKGLIARIDDKIENERINKISFAKNNFSIDLESDEDIAKKFADGDFDIFVEKRGDNYKKLSDLNQDIKDNTVINYKIKGKVLR